MIRTFAAAVFVLLAVTAPARAMMVDPPPAIDKVNITFANGDTLTGEIGWFPPGDPNPGYSFPFIGPTGLTFNGGPYFRQAEAPNGYTIPGVLTGTDIYAILADVPYLTPNEFFLGNFSGDRAGGRLQPPVGSRSLARDRWPGETRAPTL
jgi:hypothetical protein